MAAAASNLFAFVVLSVVATHLEAFTISRGDKVNGIYTTESTLIGDKQTLTNLLILCGTSSTYCSDKERFDRHVEVLFRHDGVKKRTAMFMAKILRECINQGITGCDIEDTVLALDSLSHNKKSVYVSSESLQKTALTQQHHRSRRAAEIIRSARTKRNLHGILTGIFRDACRNEPKKCQGMQKPDSFPVGSSEW